MIHLPASVRVYLCLTPCDMRKSFDSLQTLVREHRYFGRSRTWRALLSRAESGIREADLRTVDATLLPTVIRACSRPARKPRRSSIASLFA